MDVEQEKNGLIKVFPKTRAEIGHVIDLVESGLAAGDKFEFRGQKYEVVGLAKRGDRFRYPRNQGIELKEIST